MTDEDEDALFFLCGWPLTTKKKKLPPPPTPNQKEKKKTNTLWLGGVAIGDDYSWSPIFLSFSLSLTDGNLFFCGSLRVRTGGGGGGERGGEGGGRGGEGGGGGGEEGGGGEKVRGLPVSSSRSERERVGSMGTDAARSFATHGCLG